MDSEPRAEKEMDRPSFDKFLKAYNNFREYPFTLPFWSLSNDVLEEYQKLLQEHAPRLFSEGRSRITLWEHCAGDQEFSEQQINDSKELHDHLDKRNEKNIRYRHVFINAWHSRSQLNCSEGLLKKLLTFHQVAPFYLDDLVTFGEQREQLDACLSRFTDHNAYYMHPGLAPIPQLGRSGHEVRHSILLRSAERAAPGDSDTWPWRIRPCAAYHSFDLVTGKALWITTKSNAILQKKIMRNPPMLATCFTSSADLSEDRPDVPLLLEAALATHLIYFHWCEDSWRWFIRWIDQYLTEKAERGREIPVDCRPYATNLPGGSPTTADFASNSHDDRSGGCLSLLQRIRIYGRHKDSKVDACPEKTDAHDITHEEAFTLGEFSFRDLQTVTAIHRRVEEARRTCELNRQALNDICDYYRELAQYYPRNISPEDEKAINSSISRFVGKVKAITRGFERSEKQLVSLRTTIADSDIPLLESILELRGAYASRMFAEAAHDMSTLMQNVASRTADISWWGYIIAFLVFLPFFSTVTTGLLQSPIFECQAETGNCLVNYIALALFFKIAGPLTAVGLVVFWCLKARARVKMASSLA